MMPNTDQLIWPNFYHTKKLTTEAWIANNKIRKIEMTINFGQNSIDNFTEGPSLIDCLPNDDDLDWVDLNWEENSIKIWLK